MKHLLYSFFTNDLIVLFVEANRHAVAQVVVVINAETGEAARSFNNMCIYTPMMSFAKKLCKMLATEALNIAVRRANESSA